MSQGLQIWEADSSILIDTNTDTVNIIGAFRGPVDTVIISDLFLTERFFYVVHPPLRYPNARNSNRLLISVKVDGNTCSVTSGMEDISIFIGVY